MEKSQTTMRKRNPSVEALQLQTVVRASRPQLPSPRTFLIVSSFTVCWYLTSSKNAIASQQLVQQYENAKLSNAEDANNTKSIVSQLQSPLCMMLVLTALQMLVGLGICMILISLLSLFSSNRKGLIKQLKEEMVCVCLCTTSCDKWRNKGGIRVLVVGCLHFLGCLCTNMGFAFGSASVVQVIKLLEPIETLLLTSMFHVVILRTRHGVTFAKTLSVVTIVFGTSLLLMQKSIGKHVNYKSVTFALLSGIAMASRNVIKKGVGHNDQNDAGKEKDWNEAAMGGMLNFCAITTMAAIPATLCLIAVEMEMLGGNSSSGGIPIINGSITVWIMGTTGAGQTGNEAVFFHGLYNIASISVLSLISAQSHSLLNVGKRIFNVITAAIIFHENISPNGILGLCIAACGGILYSGGTGCCFGILRILTLGREGRRFNKTLSIICTGLLVFVCKNHGLPAMNYTPTSMDNYAKRVMPQDYIASTVPDVVSSLLHGRYVLWMLPFPPKGNHDENVIAANEMLICAYSNACIEYPEYSDINLRDLTIGTYYHNYIRDHAYYKVRHMSEFPFHIQAIAMISLLQSKTGSCVRTLGNPAEFCDDKPFSEYDPYKSDHLNSTNYPLSFMKDITKDTEEDSLKMDDVTTNSENFAIWGNEDLPMKEMQSGRYNSGEDVQSYAGSGWLPFVSEIRFKQKAILNYTGYYIGNALLGSNPYESNEQDFKNMEKIQLLSIYSTTKGIDGMRDYLKGYTKMVEPFGCRSKLTCRELRAKKIKSYFSACLTLTTDLQGAVLDNQEPSRTRHVYNAILSPNTTEPEKNKIIFLDVQDPGMVPKSVWNSPNAIHLKADIHKTYPRLETKMGRYDYSYKLMSTYAREAKVLVTSRIHAGLPAVALGVPVIFVEIGSGWLPGGKQSVGRVEGLLDIFHRVEAGINGKNWTFGSLEGEVPHSNGVHLADRYRASFWHRLKKTNFYEDTARLFGMIPLQRLGRMNIKVGIQDKFHFVLSRSDLGWQTQRAIEHVFFFHPNCRVFVHSNDINASDLSIFEESGYDLNVQRYDPKTLRDTHSSESLIALLILFRYGGVYVSKNTLLIKEMSLDLDEGVVLEDNRSPAMALYRKDSNRAGLTLFDGYLPSWSFPVLSSENTLKCANDPNWKLEGLDSSLAISLDASAYATFDAIKINAECYRVVEESCIYCDELHWEY